MNHSTDMADPPRQSVHYQPLVIVAIALSAGMLVDRSHGLPYLVWWWSAVALLATWWRLWHRGRLTTASVALLLSVACACGAWHHLRWSLFDQRELGLVAQRFAEPVCLEAVALEAPRQVPAPRFTPLRAFSVGDRSRLTIRPTRIRNGRRWQQSGGNALLTVDGHLLGVRAGDALRIFGRLSLARAADNPGEFDQAANCRAERQFAQVWSEFRECVTVQDHGRVGITNAIDRLRAAGLGLLQRYIRHERAGLAAALLLGVREQLDLERNEQFLETGTVHILSISGLHVGMVAAALFLFLRIGWFPRRGAMIGVAAVTILYAVVTDAGAPVARAAVLVVATCLANGLSRRASLFNALAAAAIIVACLNPSDLFRTGPQLSFLSVAAIFWAGPRVTRLGQIRDPLARLIAGGRPWPVRIARTLALRLLQALLVSGAVWGVTAPLVLARFHILSPAAVVLNLLLWLPVAGALASGFMVLALGWFFPPLAAILGNGCDRNLAAMDRLVAWGSEISASHFWLPGPSNWWLAGFYAGLGLAAAIPRLRPPRRWCVALLSGWVGVGIAIGTAPEAGERAIRANVTSSVLPARQDTSRGLECTFLSVGHGLCVVLELPDGQVLLYDTGQLGSPTAVARTVSGFLWSRGITHIDAVLLSHADLDHFNGLPELTERFSIGQVLVSPFMFEEQGASLTALSAALKNAGVPMTTISAGARLRSADGCRIEVLHPTRVGVLGSDNANSIVLAVEFAGRRILLTGDLETPGLEAVLAEEPYDCDVLLAPHHGSLRSNPQGMAAWCRPEWVVVSGGYEVDDQVPRAYRQQGAEVLHTAVVGAVSVHIDAAAMRIATFR